MNGRMLARRKRIESATIVSNPVQDCSTARSKQQVEKTQKVLTPEILPNAID